MEMSVFLLRSLLEAMKKKRALEVSISGLSNLVLQSRGVNSSKVRVILKSSQDCFCQLLLYFQMY